MPRIRTIKPEFFQDEKMAPLAPIDRLVFLGLISMADDAGRLLDNVKIIDAFIFPCSDDTSATSLRTLHDLSRIVRYTSPSGQKIIQIRNWREHQKVEKPNPRVLPPPSAEVVEAAPVAPVVEDSPKDRGGIGEESGSVTRPDLGPGTGDQGPGISISARQKPRAARTPPAYAADFEAAWGDYPPRAGSNPKRDAHLAWTARRREGVTAETLHAGVRRYAAYCAAAGKVRTEFVLQGATFFGPSRRFEEPWDPPAGASADGAAAQAADDFDALLAWVNDVGWRQVAPEQVRALPPLAQRALSAVGGVKALGTVERGKALAELRSRFADAYTRAAREDRAA